ncbi:HAD family phosphatase [Corynebacterium breve]|uniref:HAD family phosphatase n=1 Tax=Corynebacterium breve TaxID=3049799 RepID=A0ABY8VGR9_9CORY|nr:HAD family phosphatase [Corynebacterium breve]WIM67838.1 HAD family phosphatase [Corynebacterium breve]
MTALLFDLYGVILKHRTEAGKRRLEQAAGVIDSELFWTTYNELRPAYLVGDVSDQRWWQQMALRANLNDPDIAEAIVADSETLMDVDQDMVDLVLKLIDEGYTCGILSNAPESVSTMLRERHEWLAQLDAVTFSCDIGVAKPDPRAFAVAVDAMGANIKDTIFFDDSPDNVAAAEKAGLQAHLFTSMKDVHDLQL